MRTDKPIGRFKRLLGVSLLITGFAMVSGCDRFKSADSLASRAEDRLANGDHRAAIADYKTALQKDSEHAAARLGLAKLSWWSGDLDAAEKELERATAANANAADVREVRYLLMIDRAQAEELKQSVARDTSLAPLQRSLLEAKVAMLEKDRAAARAALDRALEVAPQDPEALLESARLSAAEGNVAAALEVAESVKSSPETYARALHLRGVVQMGAGGFREARDTLTEAQQVGRILRVPEQLAIAIARTEADLALNDAPAAERNVARVEALAPKTALDHYLRARIAALKNDFVTATAECQRALRADPQHLQSQLLLASSHFALGAHEQAQDVLRRLLIAKPDTIAARKLLAQIHLARNQPEEARRVLAAEGQADADTDWLMGAALLRSGSVESGIDHLERSVAANPGNVARRMELANAYIGAQQPDKATAVLAEVPAESSHATRAKILTVLASAIGKPRDEARRQIVQLASRNADDAGLHSVAASVLAGMGDSASARKLFEQARSLDPKAIEPHFGLARIDFADRKFEDARKHLREILKIEPKHESARVALAEIAWSRGERDLAQKLLEEAITTYPAAQDARLRLAQIAFISGDVPRGRAMLDQALQATTDRKTTLTSTGRVLAKVGLSEEALARFKEASAAGDREALLAAAKLHLELNDMARAREAVNSALHVAPDWRQAEELLVTIDARDGQVDRAFDRAKRLIKGDPSPATLAILKGDLHMMAREYIPAEEAYASADRQQPSSQSALKLFHARRIAGVSSPERSLTQWLARTPTDTNARRTLALHYESQGDSARAIAQYEHLVASDELDPIALNNLAWALHLQGDARSSELARKAYEAAPQHPEIADTYGWILVRMGKVSEGLPVLQSAVDNAPTNPDILYHAAAAHRASGNSQEAVTLVNEALKSKRDFASRADALQLSRELSERVRG
jgi:putative PEP-CTERM system TPR-repeat lipoprotein